MNNFKWNKKYLQWGVTAFFVIIACMAFYWIIQRWNGLQGIISETLIILSPFIYGFVFAYLLSPFVKFYETNIFDPLGKRLFKNKPQNARGFSRGMSISLAVLLMFAVLAAIIRIVLPQVYNSIQSILMNYSSIIERVNAWANKWLESFPEIKDAFTEVVGDLGETVTKWAKSSLLPQMEDIVTSVSVGVYNIVRGILKGFVSIVVSVYIMYNREIFKAQCKKVLYSIFSVKHVKNLLIALKFANKSFMGFISGKLIDSLIIGIICYIACLIMRMPDAILISVIIGITNIIPFFGPFIGAVPSALIVLMYSPIKCLIFIGFIILLQQLDGNIIGPRILGSKTGLSGFWVLFSIIVGAGLFGPVGMVIGVPLFAIIYEGIKALINSRLKERDLPVETEAYKSMDYISPKNMKPVVIEVNENEEITETDFEGKSTIKKTDAKSENGKASEKNKTDLNKD